MSSPRYAPRINTSTCSPLPTDKEETEDDSLSHLPPLQSSSYIQLYEDLTDQPWHEIGNCDGAMGSSAD
eukprot:3639496-Ditylum_brightwellii.AAC.1